jgi:hypothetical protein
VDEGRELGLAEHAAGALEGVEVAEHPVDQVAVAGAVAQGKEPGLEAFDEGLRFGPEKGLGFGVHHEPHHLGHDRQELLLVEGLGHPADGARRRGPGP